MECLIGFTDLFSVFIPLLELVPQAQAQFKIFTFKPYAWNDVQWDIRYAPLKNVGQSYLPIVQPDALISG